MSFGYAVGDIIAISKLAVKVYTAYKDAPNEYKNIAEEVKPLRNMINKAGEHLKSTTLSSDNNRQEGLEALEGCKRVLEDLDSLITKYNSLASPSTGQVFQRIRLGTTEDIANLRARLISNATLLSDFIRRYNIPTITIYYIMLMPLP